MFPQSAQQVCLVTVVAIAVSVKTRRCATMWVELVPVRWDGLEPSVKSVREASSFLKQSCLHNLYVLITVFTSACFSMSSRFLRTGLPGEVFVSKRWKLWSRHRGLFLSCWVDRSVLQPEWVTGAPHRVKIIIGLDITVVLWQICEIRAQVVCITAFLECKTGTSLWGGTTTRLVPELFGKTQPVTRGKAPTWCSPCCCPYHLPHSGISTFDQQSSWRGNDFV